MKYIVLDSHDERYDFNFTFRTTNLEPDKFIKINSWRTHNLKREDLRNGVIKFSNIERSSCDILEGTKDLLEIIYFRVIYFITIDNIDENWCIFDEFIPKNLKFGLLDLK